MKKGSKILFTILLGFSMLPAFAGKIRTEGSAMLSSGYIWRGDYVCGANFMPCIAFKYDNVQLQTYSFLAIDDSYKEIDWELSWKVKDFTLYLADYFFLETGTGTLEDYFNFRKGETTHIQEAIIGYEPHSIPFCARWFTFIHGDWLPSDGKPTFSSYLELETYHKFDSERTLSFKAGSSIFKGAYTDYTKDFAVIHLELKYAREIAFSGFSMPLSVSYVINPDWRCAYANATVGIKF